MTATIEERDGQKVVVIPVSEILKSKEFQEIMERLKAVEKTLIGVTKYVHSHENIMGK